MSELANGDYDWPRKVKIFRAGVKFGIWLYAHWKDGIEFVESLSNDSVLITLKNRDAIWLNKLLLNQGYKVSALAPKQKTLKEFFLSVTGEDSNA